MQVGGQEFNESLTDDVLGKQDIFAFWYAGFTGIIISHLLSMADKDFQYLPDFVISAVFRTVTFDIGEFVDFSLAVGIICLSCTTAKWLSDWFGTFSGA